MSFIIREKSFKISLFTVLILSVLFLPFANQINANELACEDGECIAPPTSNVDSAKFDLIYEEVTNTDEFAELKQNTSVGLLDKSDTYINIGEAEGRNAAKLGFVFGENIQDNLAYLEIAYDLDNKEVLYVQYLYAEKVDSETSNITMVINDEEIFTMNFVNETGDIIGDDGNIISQEKFYDDTLNKLAEDGWDSNPNGWCEWVIGALCGAGGGTACYALAIALGLTTGPGGIGLATLCGMIGALGCTGAVKAIC